MSLSQNQKADRLRAMHQGPGVLVLPNAWDGASARVFEVAGFEAIGTTSAGVAYTLGFADGENVPREEMLAATARIARRVAVPVTADIEAGFGESLDELAATIRGVIEAGAVGVNLEDTADGGKKLADVKVAIERVKVVIETAAAMNVPLVVNARTEVYLLGLNDFRMAVDRLNAYRDAGADCVFAPGVVKREDIAALAKEVRGPLNILAVRGTPPIAELQALGVRRVSVGSGPIRATMALTQAIATELRTRGTYESLTSLTIPYPEVNKMMRVTAEK